MAQIWSEIPRLLAHLESGINSPPGTALACAATANLDWAPRVRGNGALTANNKSHAVAGLAGTAATRSSALKEASVCEREAHQASRRSA